MVAHMDTSTTTNATSIKKPDLLKSLTKPVTKLVVQLDKEVLTGWAQHLPQYDNTTTVLKPGCHRDDTGSRICSYLLAHLGPEGGHVVWLPHWHGQDTQLSAGGEGEECDREHHQR